MKKGEEFYEAVRLLVEVAHDAPLRPSRTYAARVRWSTVVAIRAELERLGVPWAEHYPQARQ
jgi:hypothetical protein